jgi:hypothetical protein
METLEIKSLLPSLYKREEFPLFSKGGEGIRISASWGLGKRSRGVLI